MNHRSLLDTVARGFQCSWKALVLTDITCKIIAFVVLTPLVGVLFRGLVALSGRSILADRDILLFFLGPVGWVCFTAVGSLWLGIFALDQSALLGIICVSACRKQMGVLSALQFAAANGRAIVEVTARMLALVLLAVSPFIALVGLIYFTLLTEYDINYYIIEKPPVFWLAVGLSCISAVGIVAVFLRLATSWFFVLPLVLFEKIGGSNALRVSRERVTGNRRTLLLWIAGWVLSSIVLSALATIPVVFLGRVLVPRSTGSLELMAVTVGLTLSASVVVNLVVNLLSSTTLATILFGLYRKFGGTGSVELENFNAAALPEDGTGFKMTRKRLLSISIIGMVLAAVVGVAAIETVRLDDRTEITAHRGSSASTPENTLAAVKKAIEDGADWVEVDVQETADGKVVVLHDSDFMRVAGVDLKIWDATMADLVDIDIGSWFGPEFKDERVPTLGDVLAECKGKVGVNIELKYYGHDEDLEKRVIDVVEAHGMSTDVVIMSLRIDAVRKAKSLRPDWKVGLLTAAAVGKLTNFRADFFAVSTRLAHGSFVRSAHDIGKEVHVWTVNDAVTMSTMIGRNVDCLITDKPALARAVLQQRAQMSAPERLLLELAGDLGVVPELGQP